MIDDVPLLWVPPSATHITLRYCGETDGWLVRVAHVLLEDGQLSTVGPVETYGPLKQAEAHDVIGAVTSTSMGDWGV